MKTSNKLLLGAAILCFVCSTGFALYIKNSLVPADDESLKIQNGAIVTKDLGEIESGAFDLRIYNFKFDPNSTRITVKGPENLIPYLREILPANKIYLADLDWRALQDLDVDYDWDYLRENMEFTFGVKNLDKLKVSVNHDAHVQFIDTINVANFNLYLNTRMDTLDLMLMTDYTSIGMHPYNRTNLKLSGAVQNLDIDIPNARIVDASGLKVKDAVVDLQKNSKTNLNVSGSLMGRQHRESELILLGEATDEMLLKY